MSDCAWAGRYFDHVSTDGELVRLIGRTPDPALLSDPYGLLPDDVGRPEPLPKDRTHERLVAVGVTLTGASLIGGSVLALAGAGVMIADGSALGVIALILGVLLVATHWGWVHFAEIGATRLDARRHGEVIERREDWLARVEPYTRFTVATRVRDDGAIVIERVAHIPKIVGERLFSFERYVARREVHSGEESGVLVTERAEELRREAALDTQRERDRFEAARDALQQAALEDADEAERLAVVKAASQALSDQINRHLQEPPLIE
jgi:hypothetical protein